jgi:4-hydroxy-3-methylbut-2-en-1-yl diphosphate synthase IspG/GcpE
MNRYGDARGGHGRVGAVRAHRAQTTTDIVLSMKASNPEVADQAYRLLCA